MDESRLPEEYRPLSPWAYFGYSLLFNIPIAGFVLLIVFSFKRSNINRRNFARSYFCSFLLALIIFGVLCAMGVATASLSWLGAWLSGLTH